MGTPSQLFQNIPIACHAISNIAFRAGTRPLPSSKGYTNGQVMAATVVHEAWVDCIAVVAIASITSLTDTLTLTRADINAVGMDVTVPSALLHAVVYSHTGLPISSPAHVALAGGIARASTGAQGIRGTASSFWLAAQINGLAGKPITFISIHADTPCCVIEAADSILMAVLGQPTWATILGGPVTELPSIAFLAGPGLTHTPTARPVVTHTMDTATIFIAVLAMFVWV